MISGAARLAGVVGWPVAHSRSPRLHGHWLARHGIDGAYVPLPVHPDDLIPAVHGLRAAGFRGLNVTLPHKQAVMRLCDRLEPSAHQAGAVNTLVFGPGEPGRPGEIVGSNTDGTGFMANLSAHGVHCAGSALILGAGGAARAIAAALLGAGCAVAVCNRTGARSAALADALPGLQTVPWAARSAALDNQALLVNTTQLGMDGQPPLEIDLAAAPASMVVADIVYAPLLTPLLAAASACGLVTVDGIGMLLHQAVPGFAAWFGTTPVVDRALQDAVLA